MKCRRLSRGGAAGFRADAARRKDDRRCRQVGLLARYSGRRQVLAARTVCPAWGRVAARVCSAPCWSCWGLLKRETGSEPLLKREAGSESLLEREVGLGSLLRMVTGPGSLLKR